MDLKITLNISIGFILKFTYIASSIGLVGIVLNRKSISIVIMSVELLVLSVNLNFASFSIYLNDVIEHIFTLFVLARAAAEWLLEQFSINLKSQFSLKQ